MQLIINGAGRSLEPAPDDLARLVAHLGLEGKRIAIELNGRIVPRSRYPGTALSEGDRIEIVGAVGGG